MFSFIRTLFGCKNGNHWYVSQGGRWVCQFCGESQ
jgi:hypothetical protein